MRIKIDFDLHEVVPDSASVLARLGVEPGAAPSPRVGGMIARARELFLAGAAPRGVLEEISRAEFEEVYRGEGRNEPETPVADVQARADRRALFAVTVGEAVSEAIERAFTSTDFAVAYALDAMASAATSAAANLAVERFLDRIAGRVARGRAGALPYSPGYCGWDITGQRKLFERLRPEEVGIRLNERCLMIPLKSVSGVILAGGEGIHDFEDSYPFCRRCGERSCRERQAALRGGR